MPASRSLTSDFRLPISALALSSTLAFAFLLSTLTFASGGSFSDDAFLSPNLRGEEAVNLDLADTGLLTPSTLFHAGPASVVSVVPSATIPSVSVAQPRYTQSFVSFDRSGDRVNSEHFLAPINGGTVVNAPDAILASATWNTTPTDGLWSNGTNWTPGAAPGSTTLTTNGDTATFNNSSVTAITVDANRNLKFITFDLAASAYTFSGGPFKLSSAGVISMAATFSGSTNTVETFNTNVLLVANGTFTNASTTAGTSLNFAGAVTQDATVTAAQTLTVNGVGNGQISGVISNGGGAGASLAVTKGGTGTWSLTNANNSYTGATTDGAGGTLSVQVLANGGSNSSIGASSNAATNLIINASTFQYVGSGNSTDRLFQLGAGNSTIDSSGSGAVNFTNPGSIVFSATSARTLILAGSNTGNNTLAPTLGNPSAGALSVTKNGGGTWILTANNTFSGATTINAGTLSAAGTSGNQALGGTSGVTVSTGGTFLLGASNQIKDAATVNLGAGPTAGTGGIFNTGGFNEGPAGGASGSTGAIGALTLNSNSTIDFTNGTSSNLLFSSLTYTAGTAVTIGHWTGTLGTDNGAATNDRLLFISTTGLTDAQLASIQFTNDAGANLGTGATQIAFNGYFELVPVPEPSTWIGGALALVAVGWTQRKRFAKRLRVIGHQITGGTTA